MNNQDKYIKCEDALSAVRYWMRKPVFISDAIEAIPAADVVEIVRCKDCRYWDTRNYLPQPDGMRYGECECECMPIEVGDTFYPDADFFCKYGKRKTDNA